MRKKPENHKVLVAIPVYNELKYVEQVVGKVLHFHDQVLFVDDGSTDGTAELLEQNPQIHLVRHPKNRGYGRSIIDAFSFARAHGYEWVITMDCDEQHEPEMIPEFIRHIRQDRWDIISGSRYLEAHQENDLPPGDRRAINATITATLNELFHFGITDAFCGFKAHRVTAMIPLDLDESGYAFPLQLWPRVAHAGLRVKEIAVKLIYNDPTRHFGGGLDDAQIRLRHYLDVLDREIDSFANRASAAADGSSRNDRTCSRDSGEPMDSTCGCRA